MKISVIATSPTSQSAVVTSRSREVDQGLAAMLRFRWAVQASYFAWRIANNDLTGISSPDENEKGLEDARRSLTF